MNIDDNTAEKIKKATLDLLAYCKKDDWAGWDPYDALNSRLFKLMPFLNSRIPRLAMIQLLKRSPLNFRKPLLIPKTRNPKALAIFLTASIKLAGLGVVPKFEVIRLIDMIEAMRSANERFFCWGYSFPWQTRTLLVPRGAPNLVCTTFVANALLDAYKFSGEDRCLKMASSAADYIVEELFYTESDAFAGYSYPTPDARSRVHNANFLGAALLSRVANITGENRLINNALQVARYSASRQKQDGSWDYGENDTQHWVDNFHTGYNLCALQDIKNYTGADEFDHIIKKGFNFYIEHFFRQDGAPKYFHNKAYPLDVHCVAQSIITLLRFRDLSTDSASLALSVFHWSLSNLQNPNGYFYYQITPYYRNRISYIRWTQAWMLLALTILWEHNE